MSNTVASTLLTNKNVYISAPKRLFDSSLYERACEYVRKHNIHSYIDPKGMFESNHAWAQAFPDYLVYCDTMIVISDDYIVGKGVFDEYQYFHTCGLLPAYYYSESGAYRSLIEILGLQVINEDDWKNYAMIVLK